MAIKTKPIGVRIKLNVVSLMKDLNGIEGHQQMINYLESFWLSSLDRDLLEEYISKDNVIKLLRNRNNLDTLAKVKKEAVIKRQNDIAKVFAQTPQEKASNEVVDGPEIDFGEDMFLNIEKYTKFPVFTKPKVLSEQITWKANKKRADDMIRRQWDRRKVI